MANPNGKIIDVPLNRVEGDLEIRVELDGGQVTDAWSAGVMYRGIENMLKGRGARDGLVITPRICGICGTAHLVAAVKALEAIGGIEPPANAVLIRNLALMAEHVQSDVRHGILMFMVDFANPAYAARSFYAEARARFEPFKGQSVVEAIRETKKILEIVAVLGGQWPHSSYMVPGGVVSTPSASDLAQCASLLHTYRAWYEQRILGCSIERWQAVQSPDDLEQWLRESPDHHDSDLGFFIRLARETGLDRVGRGHGSFISFGQLEIPAGSPVAGANSSRHLIPAGFAQGTTIGAFDQARVSEHVAHSWYVDYEGGRHPFEGITQAYACGAEGEKYSWAKAPRYQDLPAETGPLAEMVIAGHPLFTALIQRDGPSVFTRELARLVRPANLLPVMRQWFAAVDPLQPSYAPVQNLPDGRGAGLSGASRGALGHWVEIKDGSIQRYQIITPTAWNGSPRDAAGVRGPWEEALLGVEVREPENPVELGHVIRSFDACLVCTVHGIQDRGRRFRVQL